MLYDPRAGVLFLHVPRTAGTSITNTLAAAFPDALIDNFDAKHRGASYWFSRLGVQTWRSMSYRFCVIRNPWEQVESDYRNTLRASAIWEENPNFRMHIPLYYQEQIRRVVGYSGLDEFFLQEFEVGRKFEAGFYGTFCLDCGQHELGVDALCYDEIEVWWPVLCRRIGITETPLIRCNGGGQWEQAKWTEDLIRRVSGYFEADIQKFQFQPPKSLVVE